MRSYWPRYLKDVMKALRRSNSFHSWDKWTNFAFFRSHIHTRKMMNWSRMPKMLLRVFGGHNKIRNLNRTTNETIYTWRFRGCFSNGNEILLKYNFSLVRQSYADRGFVLLFANHRNLELTLKPSGLWRIWRKNWENVSSRLQLEMKKQKQQE